jgi:uncharacterized protein
MKKFIKENLSKVAIVVIVIILVLLTSKFLKTNPAPPSTTELTTKDTENANIANPASVNCASKGGKLSIVDKPEGQVGMCTLSDGTVCEEWAYFRGECREK